MGAIYRIRQIDQVETPDPRGQEIDWARQTANHLMTLLGDSRTSVRRHAVRELVKRGPESLDELANVLVAPHEHSDAVRLQAVWALTQLHGRGARQAVRVALDDSDSRVRVAAMHAIGLSRDAAAFPALVSILKSSSPFERRCAVASLGRIGDTKAVPFLLELAREYHDRPLEHAIIYALIEFGDATQTRAGLDSSTGETRRTTLIALDQMEGGGITPDIATRALADRSDRVRQAARWIIGHHQEWAEQLVGYFEGQLEKELPHENDQTVLSLQLTRFAGDSAISVVILSHQSRCRLSGHVTSPRSRCHGKFRGEADATTRVRRANRIAEERGSADRSAGGRDVQKVGRRQRCFTLTGRDLDRTRTRGQCESPNAT